MIRGSFGACGTGQLPEPIGQFWIVPTNVGEWHILTERGFYLTPLFQADPMKIAWPEQAIPGAVLDNVPPGMGGEDFGGSMTLARDGKLYVQAGKTAFWNAQVVGLETVKAMPGGSLQITETDVTLAQALREKQLQSATGEQRMTIHKMTPKFTGDINRDFNGAEIVNFRKQEDASIRCAAAWDVQNLYLAWDVKDATPWTNGATDPAQLYLYGDTVNFQLATDPKADKKRTEAAAGDLRLSIGNFRGTATAVVYRRVATDKHPKTFSSGVVKEYVMESVLTLSDAKIDVKKRDKAYTVEAAIPLASLDLAPAEGLTLRGDFGATHGDAAGQRTRLRTFWNNQHTGIVDDAVFELKMEPGNWGVLEFGK